MVSTGNEQLLVVVAFIYIADMVCGVLRALKLKQFSSKQFIKGIFKAFVYAILIVIGVSLDKVLHTGSLITGMTFAFIIITDSISIIENLHLL